MSFRDFSWRVSLYSIIELSTVGARKGNFDSVSHRNHVCCVLCRPTSRGIDILVCHWGLWSHITAEQNHKRKTDLGFAKLCWYNICCHRDLTGGKKVGTISVLVSINCSCAVQWASGNGIQTTNQSWLKELYSLWNVQYMMQEWRFKAWRNMSLCLELVHQILSVLKMTYKRKYSLGWPCAHLIDVLNLSQSYSLK